MTMRRLLAVFLIATFAASHAVAAPLGPGARTEIDGLMSKLETSGCEFNRNGTWYPATEVKAHLLRKLKYLEDRGAVQSAEQFIELGASSSSASGQAYLVRCGNGTPVTSRIWLLSQLQAMRAAGTGKGAAP